LPLEYPQSRSIGIEEQFYLIVFLAITVFIKKVFFILVLLAFLVFFCFPFYLNSVFSIDSKIAYFLEKEENTILYTLFLYLTSYIVTILIPILSHKWFESKFITFKDLKYKF